MNSKTLPVLIIFQFASVPLFGNIVEYGFSGTVAVPGTVWGSSIGTIPVAGQFSFDNTVLASSASGNQAIYPQNIPNGFSAQFGSIPVSANSYNVHVVNDQLQPNGTVADVLTVEWASNDTPALPMPLNENGVNQPTGIFSVTLQYPSTTFSDTSLPQNLPLSNFNGFFTSFLSDNPSNIHVIYSINPPLVSVPEPPCSVLIVSALLAVGTLCRKLRKRTC